MMPGPIAPGRSLDRRVVPFRVVRRIARGERTEVLLAEPATDTPPGSARWFALKRLRPELLGDEDATSALRREIELAGRLRHPRLPRILDRRIEGRSPWMTMSYVDGPDLGRLLLELGRRGRLLDVRAIVVIAGGVIDALRYLHRDAGDALGGPATGLPVVHGSVTPQDVLIGTDGDVRLTDLGRAWFAGRSQPKVPTTRGVMTAMSPEELRDQPVSERTDIFHLGTLLYECFLGRHPFLMSSVQATAREVGLTTPVPVVQLRPDVPVALSNLVQRCLEPDPDQRFRSVGEVGRALAAMDLPGYDDGTRSLARELVSVFPEHNDASRPWVLRGGGFHPPFLPMVLSWLPAPPVVRETPLPPPAAVGGIEQLRPESDPAEPPWERPQELSGSFLSPRPRPPGAEEAPTARWPGSPDDPLSAVGETTDGFEPITDPVLPSMPPPPAAPPTPDVGARASARHALEEVAENPAPRTGASREPPLPGAPAPLPAGPAAAPAPSRLTGPLIGAALVAVVTALGFALFVPRTPTAVPPLPPVAPAPVVGPEVRRQPAPPSDGALPPLEGDQRAERAPVPLVIATNPVGAQIYVDGVEVGVSPVTVARPAGALVHVQARAPGRAAAARLYSIPEEGGSLSLTLEPERP